jgi:hypothetical protein
MSGIMSGIMSGHLLTLHNKSKKWIIQISARISVSFKKNYL